MKSTIKSNIIIPDLVFKSQTLVDKSKSGRIRPWKDKKNKTSKNIAPALFHIDEGRAMRCLNCGTQLSFNECPKDGYKKLTNANFCRDRLCPLCNWRRSLRLMYEISLVLHKSKELYPTHRFIFLTLTQKNIFDFALQSEVNEVLKGWNMLTKNKTFKKAVFGFFRNLEITKNQETDKWHPHVHALLMVQASYFKGNNYIKHEQWRELWQDVLNLDYAPEVRIEAVKKDGMAEELGKYLTKDSDIISDNQDETTENVRILNNALKGKRLVGYGGLLRKISSQVLKRTEAEDLIHIDDETHDEKKCPICNGSLLPVVYTWFGSDYKINQKFTLSALSNLINESKLSKLY